MKTSMSDRIARHAQNGRRRIRMIALFACLALVVGTCVEMALRQRGITLTASSEVLDCHVTGKVAHKHSAECYDSNKKLICQLPERELHKHDKTCYSEDGKLVCGKEEITKEHVHGPGCMRTISAPAEDGGKPKTFTHTFKDKSGTPVVRVDVVAPADALPEGTTMRATWLEESQVDKKLVQEAVTKRSGGKVLQMQAMDISFFDADGNEVEPASEVTVKLMSTIISEANAPMVVHVEDQAEAQERAEEQAANSGVDDAKAQPKPEGEVMRQLSSQEMALRDESLAKNQIAFETSDFSTYVIATTSLRHTMHASDNATVTIDVDAPVEAGLPADAKLKIDEIPRDSAEYKQYEAQALQVTGEKTSALARFFNIKIMSGDKEIQPDANVSVSVKLNDAPKADANAEAQVVHFGTKPEVVASREEDGTTQFQTKSFSVYGVMYTVDFEYQGLTAVLPGEKAMTLSKLLASLGIGESVADVTEVTFTNPNLLKVEKAGPGATIQRLIADIIAEQEAGAAESGSNAANEGAGDAGAADEDITVELSTDQDEHLVEVPLAEGEDFESVPDPVQTVPVAEGDWILTSLKSFETEETLTVKTKKAVYEIRVTDPINPWGPGMGFFGGTASWDLATLADANKASLSVSFDDSKEYAAGDEIVFNFNYQIEKAGWSDYNPWMGYPTFTYDASSVLKSDNFKDLKPGKSYLTFGGKKRGTIEVTADGKIIIQVTDTNWFNTRDEIGGTFTAKLKIAKTGGAVDGKWTVDFPGIADDPKIPVKVNITSGGKMVEGSKNGDGSYTLSYTAKVTVPSGLSNLQFVDTMNGKQQLVAGSVKLDNSDLAYTETGTGFTADISTSGLSEGDHTITYQTKITPEAYAEINGSSWENNSCTWKYNNGKEIPGGNTTHEVKNGSGGGGGGNPGGGDNPGGGGNQNQNQERPTVTKTSTAGASVSPGDQITYTLTIEGKNLAGMQYSDNMTDLQDIVGTPTVTVYKDGRQENPPADEIRRNMQVASGDSSYHSYGTQVISGTVPDTAFFKDENNTIKIEITYKTKVISQDTATANGIYGQQNVDNSFSENWTWQQHTTSTRVQYEEQPVTKVSKTAALSATDGENTLASNGTITYTIVVGDGTTTLDGVQVKDYASGDQKLSNYSITGSNVPINVDSLHPSLDLNSQNPQNWDRTALDFTFPAGTGTGPVTITYKAKPFTDATQLASANIYGQRNFSNKVTTGTDEATTNVKYNYPEKPEFPLAKTATANNSGGTAEKLDPEETVDYTIYFNKDSDSVSGLSIMDEMTDLQKLKVKNATTGDYSASVVNVTIGTGVFTGSGTTEHPYAATGTMATYNGTEAFGRVGNTVIKIGTDGKLSYKKSDGTWAEGMPVASYGWADDGVAWSHFDDGSYSDNTVRVFNFKFPTFYNTEGNIGQSGQEVTVTGTVQVTYTTTVITKDEAATSKVMGDKDIKNTVTCNETSKSTNVPATFPKNLNHNAAVDKQFNGWDDDGYTTWWTIDIKAAEDSSYPLQKLTLTEDWASGSINYSTDWPVQNFNKNVLADIDLLGAEITTDSGVTLQPGRDYTIDKEKGSFYFETLDEPVTIRIAIHNPDATINTFYQRNRVKLTWQKDQYNTGEATAEATGRRVKQEVDLTKSGKYDEKNRVITWTVIFNPYNKTVVPEWNQIKFEDTMAAGLELTGTIDVQNTGTYSTENISTERLSSAEVARTAAEIAAGVVSKKQITYRNNSNVKLTLYTYEDGTSRFVVDDIDPHSRWGNNVSETRWYEKVSNEFTGEYVTSEPATVEGKEYVKVEGIGLGLSDKTYTVTYKTKVTEEEWNTITSSLTGKETFQNHITMSNDAAGSKFEAQNKVTVEGKDYLKKHDVTQEDSDGYIIDEEEMHDNAVSYEVEVNPNKYKVNNGKSLTLTDRIDTLMELDTDSVKVYAVGNDGETRTELSNAQLAAQGIAISYNDDTRVLSLSGLADQTSYVVAYKAVSRALGSSTFTNTATLVGGGSHSDRVSDEHKITDDDSSFWGNRHGKLDLKKIDENDITNKLDDAEFSLYKVRLKNSDETANWTRADWMDLLDKMNSGDPAVLEQIKEQFKQDGEPELLCSGFKSGDDDLFLDDGIVSLEYEVYSDRTKPASAVESTPEHNTFLKEHVVYYWEETKAPTGYKITNPGPHYFVLYIDGELDDDYVKEDQRKKAAWALDDAVSLANGWTVASMSSDSEWKVNDTRDGYTSITATKRWEGDYNDTYETRPKTGILYDLYRVDKVTGQETLMEDLSPVPINDDGSGNWSSYTWYRLDASYNYTVKERAVPGYITTYSDGGKGVEGGKIIVTNTYVPKSTDVYVEKKWDPEGGAKPSQVKVSLYKILHRINEDGSITDEDPEPMGDDFTYMLTAGNGWKHAWKGLDTSDPDGNTISYTVVEDIDSVNEDDTVKAASTRYAAVYSDGGQGTVDAPENDPLTITNLANAAGSLKITKKVTVNGQTVGDTAADGAYRFRITKLNATSGNEEPATYMHGHSDSCAGNDHDQYLVGDVVVRVENGVASSAMVDNLEEGTYYVYEYEPSGDAKLVSDQRVEVKVLAGVTDEGKAPEAVFVNNVDENRVEVTKKWQSANNGVASWPEGMEVQVKVMKRAFDGLLSNVTWPNGSAPDGWSDTQWLTNNKQSYVWDNLPDDLDENESYVVVETGIRNGSTVVTVYEPSQTTTTDGVVTTNGTANITANGTTSYYNVVGERTNAKTAEGDDNTSKGVEYTLTNKQVVTVPFTKQWGTDGTDAWPSDVESIRIQLYKDGKPYSKDGDDGIRVLKKVNGTFKAYKSDGNAEATGEFTEVHTLTPAPGGSYYYVYTFTGLEAGNYTVKETQIDGQTVSDANLADGYMVQQQDGTTIRNVSAQTKVYIQKKWLKSDGKELTTGGDNPSALWPTLNGNPLIVSGTITRERRIKGSTLEIDWAPDTEWNAQTGDDHSFSANSTSKVEKTLPKYGTDNGGNILYEYRYTATETGMSPDIMAAFAPASSRDGNDLTVTNTPKPTEISFQKQWLKADGTTDAEWPQENGAPVRIPITVIQKTSTNNGTSWDEGTDYATYNVTSSSVITVPDLPAYGYNADGALVRYDYSVLEKTVPGGYTMTMKGSATGTEQNPYVIYNTPEATSVSIQKKWINKGGQTLTVWPKDGNDAYLKATGYLKRERRVYNSSEEWQADPWEGQAFEIKSTDTKQGDAWAITVSNLPKYGYADSAHYEYRYSLVAEDYLDGYKSEIESTPINDNGNTYQHVITNTELDTHMDVTVSKQWKDTSGTTLSDASGKSATFKLHEVRYAKLTVHVENVTDDEPVTVTINKGNEPNVVTETVTLHKNDRWYHDGQGWDYEYTPLEKGEAYTVSVSSASHTFTGTGNYCEFTADNQDYEANFAVDNTNAATLTVAATNDLGNSGWIAVNIYDSTTNQYMGTLGINKDWGWERTNWNLTGKPFALDSGHTYRAEIGSFDANVFESASISDPNTVNGSNGGTINVTATLGRPTLTVKAVDTNNNDLLDTDLGSVTVRVSPTSGNDSTPIIYELNKDNHWTFVHNLDGVYGTQYTVEVVGHDGTYVTNAVTNGTTTTRGTQSATVLVNASIAAKSLVITVPNPPSSHQNDGWISANVFKIVQGNNNEYISNHMLTSTNNWTVTVSGLDKDENYYVEIGSFEQNTYDSVTAPTNPNNVSSCVSGRTGGTVELSYTQPGPPRLSIVANNMGTSDPGWVEVNVQKVTNLNKDQNERVTTNETVRLNAENGWSYDYEMDGNLNTEYTVTYANSCDGTYVTGATVDASNSTRGTLNKTVYVTPTVSPRPTPKLTINVSNLTSYDEGWVKVNITKDNVAIQDSPITLNRNTSPSSWTYQMDLDGNSSSRYEVTFNSADGSVLQTASITYGGGTFDGSADHTVTLNATKAAGNGTLVFTASPQPTNPQENAYIKVYYQAQSGDQTYYTTDLNSTNNWTATISGLDASVTYNVGVNHSNGLVNQSASCSTQNVVGGGNVTVVVSSQNQGGGRIVSPVLQLFKRHLARTGDPEYCTVDVAYATGAVQTVNGNNSYTWQNLDRYDSAGNSIKYYVTEETSSEQDAIVTHGEAGYNKEAALDSTGTVEYTNTVPETEATVTVRKVFEDANGNQLGENDIPYNAVPTFKLQRTVKTTTEATVGGQYTVNFYYACNTSIANDTESPFATIECGENGIFKVTYKHPTNGYFGMHYGYDPNNPSGLSIGYIQGGQDYDHDPDPYGVELRFKVTNLGLRKIKNVSNEYAEDDEYPNWFTSQPLSGSVKNIYLMEGAVPINELTSGPFISLIESGNTATSSTPSVSGPTADTDYNTDSSVPTKTYGTSDGAWVTTGNGAPYWMATFDPQPLKEVVGNTTKEYTYYVEETWPGGSNPGYEVTYSIGGDDNPTEDADDHDLGGSGTITVTNRDTTANVKVRKEFVDAAGYAITPREATEGSATFALKRYSYPKDGRASGTVDLNVWVDGKMYRTIKANASDIVELYWTTKAEAYRNHVFSFYADEDWWVSGSGEHASIDVSGGSELDSDPTNDGEMLRLRIDNGGLTPIKSDGSDGTTLSVTGNTRNIYVNHPVYGEGSFDEKTTTGLHMRLTPTEDNTYNSAPTQTLTWNSNTTEGHLEHNFTNLPLTDGTNNYVYYVQETNVTTGYTATYSVDGGQVDLNKANGWLEGNGTVTVTNKDTVRTSVTAKKLWLDSAGNDTTDDHLGQTVELTLYRTKVNKNGTLPNVTTDGAGLTFPTNSSDAEVVTGSMVSGIKNPITLNSDTSGAGGLNLSGTWTYTWKNLPVTDDAYNYAYFVKETGTNATGTKVTYGIDLLDSADAKSGVAKATITNRETTVSATKKWQDAITGVDTTSQHTGDTATLTLYRLLVDAGTTPQTFPLNEASGLSLPEGAVKVNGTDTLGNDILNDVVLNYNDTERELNLSGAWSYEWKNLPLTTTVNNVEKDIYYYVVETATEVDGTPMAGDSAYSYVYGTDGDGFNTAGAPASGVKNVTITNRETSVKATKTWVNDQAVSQDLQNVSVAHRGEKVTFQLCRALKERGANPSGGVIIGENDVTHLMYPETNSYGTFAAFELVGDAVEVRYDVTQFNWNKEWEHLPTVVVKDNGDGTTTIYDAVYFVRESANTEGAVSAEYDTTFANATIGKNSGVKFVAITNHETSVDATKTWEGGNHTGATVTLELWKAVKAGDDTTGTFDVVQDATSGLAFPVAAENGDYVALARVDRVVLKYDSAEGYQNWHYKWSHLPTHEEFYGETYELKYYVVEAEVSENGKTYPASARYAETYNTAGDKDSGVKAVAITNYDTSVTATKAWMDQSGVSTNEAHHTGGDYVTFELWKAHKNLSGEYGVSPAANSLLQFPQMVTGNGKFDAPELVDTKDVKYKDGSWSQTWSPLPLYETIDGKTYELAYFVREKSVHTDDDEYTPSPTYNYGSLSNVNTDGVNGGTVIITNHETSVGVAKVWAGFPEGTDFTNYTATVRLYKARKAIDGLSGAYKVGTDSTSNLQLPEPKGDGTGTIDSYEPFREVVDLKYDADENKSFKYTWDNLPMYETDPESGKTYKLEYFVQETASSAPGVTATYAYAHHDNNQNKGIETATVTNTNTNRWSVKVNKYWTGGNAGHNGVVMQLTRYTKPSADGAETKDEGFLKTITLDDGNNWEYTWTGLDETINISGTTYSAKDGTLVYKVEEKTTDDLGNDRTDFAVEYEGPEGDRRLVWPEYMNGKNNSQNTAYWIVTNKPVYTGQLKLSKTFDGIELAAFAEKEPNQLTQADQTNLENAKKRLQFDITTVDTSLETVTRAYNTGTEQEPVWKTEKEDELVRTTWHLVHDKNNGNVLVWVKEPVQNYTQVQNGPDTRMTETKQVNGSDVTVAKDEPYADYVARYNEWERDFRANYDYVTYADFTNGEFQILDSADHTGPLGLDLLTDKVYDVAEVNQQGLIANHTFVAGESIASMSGSVPKEDEGTLELSNTYTPIKGTLRVTKDVTLNGGDKYDDVAAGKTFRIGIEKWDGTNWTIELHDVTTTQTIRLPDGTTTTITSTEPEPWTQTVTIGKGSTASVVFDGLELGTYRAYEVADDAYGYSVHSQSEDAYGTDLRRKIAGYQWEVTETGTYYTYDSENKTLSMVDGDGTHVGKDEDGKWNTADSNSVKVSITGNDAADGGDTGVVLSAGSEDEKSPRNAEITITNNKTETGSITVEKNLFYNGAPDETKRGERVCFGLYTGTPPTNENAVKETISGQKINMKRFVTLGQDKDGGMQHKVKKVVDGVETEVDEPYSASWGAVSFRDLPYKDGEGKDITYYVYEMENTGTDAAPNWQPVTDGTALLTFNDATKTYTVVGDSEGRVLEHEDRDQTAKFVNSIKEQGKIKVTKQVFQSDGTTLDAEANATNETEGAKFRVGLFTAQVDDHGTPETSDDTTTYVSVIGRVLTVEIGKDSAGNLLASGNDGVGEVTFENLDFALGEGGTTYYVFEVDEKGNPVIPTEEADSDVLGDYKVSYPNAGVDHAFTLTQARHDYDGATINETTNPGGATVSNTRNITYADLRILKVDKQSWVDAVDKSSATPLQGATFTLKQLEEGQAFDNSGVAYKPSGIEMTAATTAEGVATFQNVATGWYEVKEVSSPTGYLVVGDSTVYLKIDNGAVVFLQKEQGVMPKYWVEATDANDAYSATTNPNRNVMSYAAATPAVEANPENNVEAQEAVPATATVGNVAGPELPSTGGPGLWPLVYAGVALFFASVVSLALERKRGWEHTA